MAGSAGGAPITERRTTASRSDAELVTIALTIRPSSPSALWPMLSGLAEHILKSAELEGALVLSGTTPAQVAAKLISTLVKQEFKQSAGK